MLMFETVWGLVHTDEEQTWPRPLSLKRYPCFLALNDFSSSSFSSLVVLLPLLPLIGWAAAELWFCVTYSFVNPSLQFRFSKFEGNFPTVLFL